MLYYDFLTIEVTKIIYHSVPTGPLHWLTRAYKQQTEITGNFNAYFMIIILTLLNNRLKF